MQSARRSSQASGAAQQQAQQPLRGQARAHHRQQLPGQRAHLRLQAPILPELEQPGPDAAEVGRGLDRPQRGCQQAGKAAGQPDDDLGGGGQDRLLGRDRRGRAAFQGADQGGAAGIVAQDAEQGRHLGRRGGSRAGW
jgi:hypothetical protein